MYDDESAIGVHRERSDVKWHEFLFSLYDILRCQGKSISDTFSRDSSAVLNFDFQNIKSHLNQLVWNMVCTLKASREELCHIQNSVAFIHKDFLFFSDNLKCNKRIVIVFLLQFVMNDVNFYPFHVMAANCIKDLSHSSKLVNTMNKPGFCCSESTLERFLQGVRDVRHNGKLLVPFLIFPSHLSQLFQ